MNNKKIVLLVDDDAVFLKTVSEQLKNNDYEIKTLNDGYYLFDEISKNKPSLIVLDIQMPKLDGEKACRTLKNSEEYKHIPVIISTATADTIVEQKVKMYGAVEYVTKPYYIPEFQLLIKKYLGLE